MSYWYIDPDSLQLAGGPARILTGQEFREQIWPDCPVCGSSIEVDRVEVTSIQEPIPRRYIVGRWECPNECDPRRADPRRPA